MKRTKIQGLLMKVEAVEGTDSVPTAAANGIQLEESLWNTIEADYLERNERDGAHVGLGTSAAAQPSGRWAKFRAVIALKGASAAAGVPEIDVPFTASGLNRTDDATAGAEKRTWAPLGAADVSASATAYVYSAGLLFKVVGVRGKITNVDFTAAKFARVTFEFTGLLLANPVEAALPAITFAQAAVKPPVAAGVAVNLAGFAPRWHSFAFDMGTELVTLARGNAPGGHAGYAIVDYKPTVKMQIDLPSLGAFDPWEREATADTFAWSISLNSGAQYNRWSLEGGFGQVAKVPPGDRDKLAMIDLQLRCCGDPANVAPPFTFVQS